MGGFLVSVAVGLAGGLVILTAARPFLTTSFLGDVLAVYGERTAWYLTRATGTVAYLLLSGATL
jgi:hypothetical protein